MKQISFSIRWKLLTGLLRAGSAGITLVDKRIHDDSNVNFQTEKITRFGVRSELEQRSLIEGQVKYSGYES